MGRVTILAGVLAVISALLAVFAIWAIRYLPRFDGDTWADEIKPPCDHDGRWEIRDNNMANPPHGTCLLCSRQVRLDILINNTEQRIYRALSLINQRLDKEAD